MKRRLTLTREPLCELTTEELLLVAAAQQQLPTTNCFTPIILTIDSPCPTEDCVEIRQTLLCPTTR